MRREIPQKVDAQVGFAAQSPSESAVPFGATLFRRTRSASVLSITLTATALGILIPQSKAAAYLTPQTNLLGVIPALPQSSTLKTGSVASSISSTSATSPDKSGYDLAIPPQSSLWEENAVSLPSSESSFSTTPNHLSSLKTPILATGQSLGQASSLTTSAASAIQTPPVAGLDLKVVVVQPTVSNVIVASQGSEAVVHTVERGENLTEIGNKYEVSPELIAQTNRIQNPNVIDVNEDLVIPSATLSAALNPLVLGTVAPRATVVSQSAAQLGVATALLDPRNIPKSVALSSRLPLPKQTQVSGAGIKALAGAGVKSPNVSDTLALLPQPTAKQTPQASQRFDEVLIAKRSVFPRFPPTLDLPPLESAEKFLPAMRNSLERYIWPAKGAFTSGYGPRWGRMHRGIDIAAPVGTPVVAAAAGVVVTAGWNDGGYGNLVEIRHADGSLTVYAHNSRILTHPGALVNQGELVAAMGSTGRSTGPHSHFEIHPGGRGAVDPMFFLSRR